MSAEIAALDSALARGGEDAILRRKVGKSTNAVNIDVPVRVRTDVLSADQIAGKLTQNSLNVIMSPTQIMNAQWPGGIYDGPITSPVDPRIPRATDFIVIQGKEREVVVSKPFIIGGVWVRNELRVA